MNRNPLSNSDKSADLLKMGLLDDDEQERYLICDSIASGGMGMIYRAYDSHTERYVAYKVIHPELQKNKAIFERFTYESEVAARLEHPNIMPVYDAGHDPDGRPFYTMKLLKGQTLAKFIHKLKNNQSTSTFENMVEILIKVCDAISCAHEQEIIHRDLKPDNIMIGDFGEVLVLDWGLAKIPQTKDAPIDHLSPSTPSEFSQMGAVIGTPAYMAPEQAQGKVVDPRADVYSLGALLQTMLTFNPPIEGENTEEILSRVSTGQIQSPGNNDFLPDSLGEKNQRIPRSALAVIKKATQLKPENRYKSSAEFAQELKQILGGFAVNAENAGAIRLSLLLIQRHKIVSAITAIFTLLFVVVGAKSINAIHQERNFALEQHEIAKHNYNEAQNALNKLRESAEIYLSRARYNISKGEFDAALMDVQTYLKLNQHNAEAYLLLGRINQAHKNFAEAAKAFKKAQAHGDKSENAVNSLKIASAAQTCVDAHGHLAKDEIFSIYCQLISNSQIPEASQFLDDLLSNEEFSNRVFNELFAHTKLIGKLKFCPKGMLHMRLSPENKDLTPLRYFQKAIFGTLAMPNTMISSLHPLKGLAIITLDIRGTHVSSLKPLYNSTVYNLLVDDTHIDDFSALKGHKINILSMRNVPVKSLASLEMVDIRHLDIASSPIRTPNLKHIAHIPSLVLPITWRNYVQKDTFPKGTKLIWAQKTISSEVDALRLRFKQKVFLEL
ncbi:serine/threonine-protein kinase [Lentisphaera araneosa HTCC2155]|uniref:Serine/threonine-protein kinase n=1 Tax=Lentisphaera araneosa HTCC2155 TaxID=313628 RepID=A6DQ30_9BACT|nr:serine/threonine-protein kinase [Lentisphaera araneosa]EDM26271.1 serine/threonine-protein kinase [Lentisphaera araneosa HTCC2155]